MSNPISCYGNIRQLSDNVQSDHLLCVQCLVEIQRVPFASDVKHQIATNTSGTIIFSAGSCPSAVTAIYCRLFIRHSLSTWQWQATRHMVPRDMELSLIHI